jgi:hypothetical protein
VQPRASVTFSPDLSRTLEDLAKPEKGIDCVGSA